MTRTYADAGVLIAATRTSNPLGVGAFALLFDPERTFVSSVFVRLEVVPKAIYHRQQEEIQFYEAFFDRVVGWAEPVAPVVELAEREAARHGLNALDALHVAAAVLLGADELVTTEGQQKPMHPTTSVRVVAI